MKFAMIRSWRPPANMSASRTTRPASRRLGVEQLEDRRMLAITVRYDKRAPYEEGIMSQSDAYVGYLQKVKHRFLPGVY